MYAQRLQYLFSAEGRWKFVKGTLSALGVIWLLVESSSFFLPDMLGKGLGLLSFCALLSAGYGAYYAFPRMEYVCMVRGVEIKICVGDILAMDTDIAVVSSDYFDTCPDTINQKSIVGQLVHRCFRGVHSNLDDQIDAFMDKHGIVGEAKSNKSKGRKKKYLIGTTAVVNLDGRCAYLVVGSQMDASTVTVASADDLWGSLSTLWKSVEQFGSQRPISLPIWGAGLTRAPTSYRTDLFDLMMLSFFMHIPKHKVTRRLTIVIWGNDYRPDEFEHFIRTIDGFLL